MAYSLGQLKVNNLGQSIYATTSASVVCGTISGTMDGTGFTVLNSSPYNISTEVLISLPFTIRLCDLRLNYAAVGTYSLYFSPSSTYYQLPRVYMIEQAYFQRQYQRILGKQVDNNTYIIRQEWNQTNYATTFNPANPIHAIEITVYRDMNYIDIISTYINSANNYTYFNTFTFGNSYSPTMPTANQKYRMVFNDFTYTLNTSNTPISLHNTEMSMNNATCRYISGDLPNLSNPNLISECSGYQINNNTLWVNINWWTTDNIFYLNASTDYPTDATLGLSLYFNVWYYDTNNNYQYDLVHIYIDIPQGLVNSENDATYTMSHAVSNVDLIEQDGLTVSGSPLNWVVNW